MIIKIVADLFSVDQLVNFVYLDIDCDGAVKGLKELRGREGSEPNWRRESEKETDKRLKNTQNKDFMIQSNIINMCYLYDALLLLILLL